MARYTAKIPSQAHCPRLRFRRLSWIQLRLATVQPYRGDLLITAALLPGELTSIMSRAIEQAVADGGLELDTKVRRSSV